MGRMEWFRDMRALFLEISDGQRDIVAKADLVAMLSAKGPEMELEDPEIFKSRSSVVHYSFEQVRSQLANAREDQLTWDQVIDYLIQLGLAKKTAPQPKPLPKTLQINCQVESPRKCIATDRSPITPKDRLIPKASSDKVLKIAVLPLHEYFNKKTVTVPNLHNSTDLSSAGLTNLPRLNNLSSLLFLSLAGNSLIHTRLEWPPQLILLNLSNNRLTELDLINTVAKLQLLNVSHNALTRIGNLNCKMLSELYADHNDLSQIGSVCRLSQLTVLDLSSNALNCLEDFASLAILQHLAVISVRKNGLTRDYAANLKIVLPRVSVIDPTDITKHTRFHSAGSFAFWDGPVDHTPTMKVRESLDKPVVINKFLSEPKFKAIQIDTRRKPTSVRPRHSPKQSRTSSALSETASSRTTKNAFASEDHTPTVSIRYMDTEEPRILNPPHMNEYPPEMAFVNELDRRLRTSYSKPETFSAVASAVNKSVSLVTQQAIQQATSKAYGNPIAALMIGPPACSRPMSARAYKPPAKPKPQKSQRMADFRLMRKTFDT